MLGLLLLSLLNAAVPRTDGAITGTVRDAGSGRVLAGATVLAPDARREATTDRDGRYALRGLPPGSWRLTVRSIGHLPYTLHAVVPAQGVVALDVALEPLPTRLPTVAVRQWRDAPVRAPAAPPDAMARRVDGGAMPSHPLQAEPDLLRALAGGSVIVAPEAPGGLHVRGGSTDQTGYALDGVPVFNPYHASDLLGAWNTDALSQARLGPASSGAAMLSGNVSLGSKAPGARREVVGAMSTTHGRVVIDGPLGIGPATFLVSARRAWPNLVAPDNDPTFVRGESGDAYAKLEVPVAQGVLRVFSTRSLDAVDVASTPPDSMPAGVVPNRNRFDWSSSAGAVQWSGPLGNDSLLVSLWRSASVVEGLWDEGLTHLDTRRVEHGAQVTLARLGSSGTLRAGLRAEGTTLGYGVHSGARQVVKLQSAAPLLTAFTDIGRPAGRRARLGLGFQGTLARGRGYLSPHASGRLALTGSLDVSATLARRHQFVQSLRNPESVVGFVFPADLAIGATRGGLPVARGDEFTLAADLRAGTHARASLSGYAREMRGVVLVAPFEESPFLRGTPVTGSASVRGAALDGEVRTARVVAMVRYGVQRVRYRQGEGGYAPSWAPRAQLDGGITAMPTTRTALRVGMQAAFGRRVTPATGAFEWESCNLKDRGCEFAGSPTANPALLSSVRAPAYVRMDVGIRQQATVRLGARHAEVVAFGTYSNLLGRFNVLTYGLAGDLRTPIEMRPPSPLVVGLEWRY